MTEVRPVMEAGKMERAAKSEDTRVGNLNIGGGILQVGEKSYMLNPLARKSCKSFLLLGE